MEINKDLNNVLTGRKVISTSVPEDKINLETMPGIINSAIQTHGYNKVDESRLLDIYKGLQPILNRVKEVRPEVNNKIVINNAQKITRTILGYFLGTPIEIIQRKTEKDEEVEKLKESIDVESIDHVNYDVGEYQSVCGVGYKMTYVDSDSEEDETPFEQVALDPRNTFVIYSQDVRQKPLVGVTYHTVLNENGAVDKIRYYAYTKNAVYCYETQGAAEGQITSANILQGYPKPHTLGGVPIVEYPNNQFRIGDFEPALSVMNAINENISDRMNDLEQFVQALLVFHNVEIDRERFAEMREDGAIMVKSIGGNAHEAKVEYIGQATNQSEIQTLTDYLTETMNDLVGIPDRKLRGGGGGDTGNAVELRDGWADLEIVARNKERQYKKSEKQSLKLVLNILREKNIVDLKLTDIDIKFPRNPNNNLLVKTQSLQTLVASKVLSPKDALSICGLSTDTLEMTKRGEEFWGDEFAGRMNTTETNAEPVETNVEVPTNV